MSGHYTGNAISPVFNLKIGPPLKSEWSYSMSDDMFGRAKPALATEYRGTYRIDGDLAIFTGEQIGAKELRMGLNFGFPDGNVAFNRFFPDARGNLTYHRKWFRTEGREWRLAEERTLTLAPPPKDLPKKWEVAWTGARVRWVDGKKIEEPVDVTLTYTRTQSDWYRVEELQNGKRAWLPADLILQQSKGKVMAIHESNPFIGDLNGFHPGYSELPGGK